MVLEIIKRFHDAGALISFDVNYRAALWTEEKARSVIEKVLKYVDFLFVSEETSRRMMQKTGTLEEIMQSYASPNTGAGLSQQHAARLYRLCAITLTRKILFDGKFYEEEPYINIEVIDRIGSGDAYLAGVLYGLIKTGDVRSALEIGNAASAVKKYHCPAICLQAALTKSRA